MMLNGSCLTSGVGYKPYMPSTAKSYNSAYLCIPPPPSKVAASSIRSSLKPRQTLLSCSYRGISSVSSLPLHWRDDAFSCTTPKLQRESHFPLLPRRAFKDVSLAYGALSLHSSKLNFSCATLKLPRQRRFFLSPRAFKDGSYDYPYRAMTEKPKWWWRTLACLPYLMPLHMTWYFAAESYHLRPLIEKSDFLSKPYNNFLQRLPSWLLMAYTFIACFAIVKRKECPHFLRFHVMMAILLENLMHIIIIVYGWMPPFVHWGNNIGTHIWTAVTFVCIMTVLKCMKCALSGMYADIPFVSDAADFHLKYG
ncbi:protein TIC 20-I, chloroplastic-like [Ipomoea triloba]|uniref:protein TIC 20-I, chloroplastic-like n=1 Tax=Ipomoea triloba TaxID=35885 RepID=UPI00125E8AF2|nr:protein TIC 20-I, chloroplastic-like [Ipomoea triloba]